jgi:hypothetical protein
MILSKTRARRSKKTHTLLRTTIEIDQTDRTHNDDDYGYDNNIHIAGKSKGKSRRG